MTSRAVGSASKASSRCSSVTYSCRRVVASATARFKVFSSSFVIMVLSGACILFHRAQEWELISLSETSDFLHLHLSDFISKDASQTGTFPVHVEHESNRLVFAVIEYSLQDEDHKLHRREIVVMQKDLVERRALQLCLTLSLLYDPD